MTGLDYSAGTIPGAVIRAAGHSFVIRYVDDPKAGLSRKHITPPEYADLVHAGLDVWLVFEIGTGDMLGGFNAGAANARRALAGANWVGYPGDHPIFMASDMHLTGPQVRTAVTYLDGAASVLGHARTGCYGFPELTAAAQGHAAVFWGCGHDPGPGGAAHIWQRNDGFVRVGGLSCDLNVLYRPFTAAAAPPTDAGPYRRRALLLLT